jgi:hypothetical protein
VQLATFIPTSKHLTSVERWDHNAFDAYYYGHHWTSTSNVGQLYAIDSVVPIDEGKYLADYQMGANKLKILNVANPKNVSISQLIILGHRKKLTQFQTGCGQWQGFCVLGILQRR